MDLALNNLQRLICHKIQPTEFQSHCILRIIVIDSLPLAFTLSLDIYIYIYI